MRADPVRLGIIGANPERGWASMTHLPAAAAVAEIDLVAVATTRQESAEAARDRYGAAHAFADGRALIAHPDVEAVTVAVKVPDHFELVRAALEAGKHVYCEWPLGADTDEASQLAELAARRGLHTIVGLQTGRSAAVGRVRELIGSGAIGRLLSATISDKSAYGGEQIRAEQVWSADPANGLSIFTITVGHGLEILNRVAGPFRELSATLATRYPHATVIETGELIPVGVPDQVAIAGVLADDSVVTTHFRAGVPYDNGFRLDLHGTLGSLHFASTPSLYHAVPTVEHTNRDGERSAVEVPAGHPGVADGPVAFVAQLYQDLATAIRTGETVGPDFAYAVSRHRLLDSIRTASEDGRRQRAPN